MEVLALIGFALVLTGVGAAMGLKDYNDSMDFLKEQEEKYNKIKGVERDKQM